MNTPDYGKATRMRRMFRERMRKRNPHCRYCGVPVSRKSATIDHVRPKSKGGDSSARNTVLTCRQCNAFKSDRTPWEVLVRALRICFVAVLLKVK